MGRVGGPSTINLSDLNRFDSSSPGGQTPFRETLPTPQESPPFFGTPHSRLLELQIMNHYTYMHAGHASDHHPALRLMWSYTLPQAALGSELLMDAVLAQGAQHLHVHRPQDERMRLVSHQYMGKALRNLHACLASTTANKGLSFAASVMMAFQTFLAWKDPCSLSQSYHLPIEWLMMSQGTHSVWNSGQAEIYASFMRPLLDELPPQVDGSPAWRGIADPFQDLAFLLHEETDAETQDVLLSTLEVVRGIYISMQEGSSAMITRRSLLAFPSRTNPKFIDLCRLSDPRAMLILAYYFTIMKPVEDIWWLQGRPDYEINGIMGLLPARWQHYMAWPLQVIADISRGGPRILTPQPRGLPSPLGEPVAVTREFNFNSPVTSPPDVKSGYADLTSPTATLTSVAS